MSIDSLVGAAIGAAIGSVLGFLGALSINHGNRSHRSRMAGRALIADLNSVAINIRTIRDLGYGPVQLVSPVWTDLLPEIASLFGDDLEGFSNVAMCYFHVANAE